MWESITETRSLEEDLVWSFHPPIQFNDNDSTSNQQKWLDVKGKNKKDTSNYEKPLPLPLVAITKMP
jgi:hypothetical protein